MIAVWELLDCCSTPLDVVEIRTPNRDETVIYKSDIPGEKFYGFQYPSTIGLDCLVDRFRIDIDAHGTTLSIIVRDAPKSY